MQKIFYRFVGVFIQDQIVGKQEKFFGYLFGTRKVGDKGT